jgi:hypothetical protein
MLVIEAMRKAGVEPLSSRPLAFAPSDNAVPSSSPNKRLALAAVTRASRSAPKLRSDQPIDALKRVPVRKSSVFWIWSRFDVFSYWSCRISMPTNG